MSFIPTPCPEDGGLLVTLDEPIDVVITGQPVEVTFDEPIDVNITGGFTPGSPGGFTPVAGSRWQDTDADDISLLGTVDLIIQSPTPAAGQRVVVDYLSYFAEVAAGLALSTVDVLIREVDTPANIIWQGSLGFTATAGIGAISTFEANSQTIFGPLGEQLEMVLTIESGVAVTLSTSANFGGYLASN